MKRQKVLWLRWLMSIMVLSFLLSGCAAGTASGPGQASAPSRMEDMLVRAGFKAVPESNPQCQAVCRKLIPDQLTPQKRGGQMAYAYYASGSHLLYMGDEAAYQRFIDLAVMENLTPRSRAVYETVPNDPEFWSLWQNSQGGG